MIPPSTTITPEGERTRRILLRILAVIVGLNVVVAVANSLSSGGSVAGPDGSSFVTTRAGTAAAAGMLGRLGVEVAQSRVPLDEAKLQPAGSLLLLEVGGAGFTGAELEALQTFLTGGGTVLVAGRTSVVGRLVEDPSRWVAGGVDHARLVESPAGSEAIVPLSQFGSFEMSPADTPVLQADDGTVVAVRRTVGSGSIVWVADSHPFRNEGIGTGDAALALVFLIDVAGPVVFDEYRHGFRQAAGLWDVIPSNWRTALLLAGIVGLLALIAYGRRLGPPYDIRRRLSPGREIYLQAVAGALARSKSPEDALELIREEARAALTERTPPGTELSQTAASEGLDPAAAEALFGTSTGHDTLLAADRALATLKRERQ